MKPTIPGCRSGGPGLREVATQAAAARATASPPSVGATLASDGFGHSATLWPGGRSALTGTFYDGVTWSTTHTITTGLGPAAPALAFFAPNRAIAAWAESSLPLSTNELPPSAYNDVVHSYHIATSVWDGSAWSAAQDLTVPTTPGTGEGKVTLAACPATTAGCPAGGAVTAVWVRDVAGDSALRQFRLYYATYQDGHGAPRCRSMRPARAPTCSLPSPTGWANRWSPGCATPTAASTPWQTGASPGACSTAPARRWYPPTCPRASCT